MRQSNWERRLTMTTRRRRGLDCGGGPVTDYRYGPYGPYMARHARTILGAADAIQGNPVN